MDKILKSAIAYKGPCTENLIEFLKNGLRKHSDQVLLVDSKSDRSWTGKDIENVVSRLARYLIDECGLEKGDVCSLHGEPCDTMALLILAVISAGGVSLFLTSGYRPREVLDTAKTTNSKFLISFKKLLKSCLPVLTEIDEKIKVISCDEICDGYKNGCKSIGHLFVLDACGPSYTCEDLIERANIDPEKDFGIIQFSSGTTGKPKPIPRTHKNLCHLVTSVDHEELMNLKPGEVLAGSLSVTHRPGTWALLSCIHSGGKFIMWDNLTDPLDALKLIEKYRVTIFSSSLPLLAMLGNVGIKNKANYDLSSLKHVITSGSKIVHPDLPKSLVKEFDLVSLRQCFGMTESGWVFLIEQSLAKDNYLTVGHVCPSTEAMIIDRESGKPVGEGVRGELVLRGPQIFPGYLTDKKGVFNRSDFTEDGWFKTGDQAYYDSSKLVYIEGRFKELLLLSNNYRFFPNDIETVISEHPSVEGVYVIKIGEHRSNIVFDIARAYVTLKQGAKLTGDELSKFIDERTDGVLLDEIRFLDKFPRLANGKVDKQALREMQ